MGHIANSIKRILPERAKRKLRRVEDYVRRSYLGHTNSLILENRYGVKFILDPWNHNPIRWQIQEDLYSKEFEAIRKLVKKGGLVFDVGANNGFISAFLSKTVGSEGRVYSFEPNPEARAEFRKNIALNESENITLVSTALTSRIGTAQLYCVNNHRLSSLSPVSNTNYGENRTVSVITDTIDNYCAQNHIAHIDFFKIDVEGFEYEVLVGAEHMLKSHSITAIQFEMWERNEKLLGLLRENGYEVDYTRTNASNYYACINNE